MQKRHDDILTTRLEMVLDEGCAHVLKSELYRWYEKQRITVRVFRDLEARWQEASEGEAGQLYRVRGGDGFFLLREDRLKPVSDDSDVE